MMSFHSLIGTRFDDVREAVVPEGKDWFMVTGGTSLSLKHLSHSSRTASPTFRTSRSRSSPAHTSGNSSATPMYLCNGQRPAAVHTP